MFRKIIKPIIEYVNYLSFLFSQILVLCFLVLALGEVTGFLFFVQNKEPWLSLMQFAMYGSYAYFILEILGWLVTKLITHIYKDRTGIARVSLFFGYKSPTVRLLEVEVGVLLTCTIIIGIIISLIFTQQPWWDEKDVWIRATVRTPSTGPVILAFTTAIRKFTLKMFSTQ